MKDCLDRCCIFNQHPKYINNLYVLLVDELAPAIRGGLMWGFRGTTEFPDVLQGSSLRILGHSRKLSLAVSRDRPDSVNR